jgi:hypothetical protein
MARAQILRAMGLLETIATHTADRYAWPNPFTIEARSCGTANARWRQRVLTLCYELINEFIELYLNYSKALPGKYRAARKPRGSGDVRFSTTVWRRADIK